MHSSTTVTSDPEQPVVMFALEWCEFCWSVRKLFTAFGIPYRSVDLDSADYQKDNWGGHIRNVLKVRTKSPTIPQIFVGKQHIGGAPKRSMRSMTVGCSSSCARMA